MMTKNREVVRDHPHTSMHKEQRTNTINAHTSKDLEKDKVTGYCNKHVELGDCLVNSPTAKPTGFPNSQTSFVTK